MAIHKKAHFALTTLALAGVLLSGCGGKSDDVTPDASGKSAATPGAATTSGAASTATGSLANPQPPEGGAK